jgi:magnesium chelatase family protein
LVDRIYLQFDGLTVRISDLSLPPSAEEDPRRGSLANPARAFFTYTPDVRSTLPEKIATPDVDGKTLLTEVADRLHLSARGYQRVLRVARTLVDLDDDGGVWSLHIAEALSYLRMAAGR